MIRLPGLVHHYRGALALRLLAHRLVHDGGVRMCVFLYGCMVRARHVYVHAHEQVHVGIAAS